MHAPQISSPNPRQANDLFMGNSSSRPQTRPPTPFNPSFSVPATPPDLYLVTRNSPNLSQSVWENFQPDQLFPEGSGTMSLPFSPPPPPPINPNLDPNLVPRMGSHIPTPTNNQAAQLPNRVRNGQMNGSPLQGHMMQPNVPGYQSQSNAWSGSFDNSGMHEAHSPSDSWSNSSLQGPAVPTTLNVEDW